MMRRRTLLALALLAPAAAFAQDNAALNDAASDAAMAFMKALRKNDIETALQFAGAPFVAEDAQLLATEADVKDYLTEMCAQVEAGEMPNAVLAILDYEQSRAATAEQALKLRDAVLAKGDLLVATGRDGISRGVLLVKASGVKPVFVGVGYCRGGGVLMTVKIADFEIPYLAELLGLPLSDEKFVTFLGPHIFKIRRSAYYGFVERRSEGVDIVFQEAPWVLAAEQIVNEKALHLAAFHFHRQGHEKYPGYAGPLPNGIVFNDSQFELRRKMGEPFATGGGGISAVPPRTSIPKWMKYPVGDKILHLQLDPNGQLEMATLMTPDVRLKAN